MQSSIRLDAVYDARRNMKVNSVWYFKAKLKSKDYNLSKVVNLNTLLKFDLIRNVQIMFGFKAKVGFKL